MLKRKYLLFYNRIATGFTVVLFVSLMRPMLSPRRPLNVQCAF